MTKLFVREGIPADLDLGTVRPGTYELVKTMARGEARNSVPEAAYILDNLTVSVMRVEQHIANGYAEIIPNDPKPEDMKMAIVDKIYSAIMVAMNEIGFIGKDKKNPQQGYNFRGIDDVLNSLQPALIKAKLFIVPRIIAMERQERQSKSGGLLIYTTVRGEYDFVSGEDGSKITASTYGEGMDSSDKSTNKAMSAALKYAVIQTFSIPTKEMIDGDADHPEPEKKTPTAPKTDSKAPAESKPIPEESAVADFIPSAINKRDGETKGKKWTKYTILNGEEKFTTFNISFAELAKKANFNGKTVRVWYKSTEKWGNEIELLVDPLAQREPGSDDDNYPS
jgi:hypothetical protein